MARPLRLRSATRRRLIWLVALLLLWQQAAFAAYVCQPAPATTSRSMAMPPGAAMGAMAGMDCHCPDLHGSSSAGWQCQQLCAPDQAKPLDAHQTSVPPSALTALPPMLMLMSFDIVTLQSDHVLAQLSHRRTPPPNPRLLFCSLLI